MPSDSLLFKLSENYLEEVPGKLCIAPKYQNQVRSGNTWVTGSFQAKYEQLARMNIPVLSKDGQTILTVTRLSLSTAKDSTCGVCNINIVQYF